MHCLPTTCVYSVFVICLVVFAAKPEVPNVFVLKVAMEQPMDLIYNFKTYATILPRMTRFE